MKTKKFKVSFANNRTRQLVAGGVVSAFAIFGVITLISSHAAVPTTSLEPENGTKVGVTVGSDPTASNGSYVQFGSTAGSNTGHVTPPVTSSLSFIPLVGAFVGAITPPAPTADTSIFLNSTLVGNDVVPNRAAGLDMINDTGTGGDTWHHITELTPWASETSDNGGNSNLRGDLSFINSTNSSRTAGSRAVVMSLHMVPTTLDSPVTYGGATTSTCPQDPSANATYYNDDRACMLAGANGDFNKYWATLSQRLVNNGLNTPNMILRIGWECSGNWMPWSAYVVGEANYAKYYQNIVTSMRSAVPGTTIKYKFAWDCGTGKDLGDKTHADSAYSVDAYPGDSYVDYLDFDPYDNGNGGLSSSTSDWNTSTVNADHGLAWWASYATAHNKYLGFTEWGSPNDDPSYIQEVHDFIYKQDASGNYVNRVAYQDYFEVQTLPTDNPPSQDFNVTHHVSSYALYKLLFGTAPVGKLPQ